MIPSAPARVLLRLLSLYKALISPLFTGSCRYLPSCSDYMAEAILRHGALSGVMLGLYRLGRCHPFGGSGHDPVPHLPVIPEGAFAVRLRRPKNAGIQSLDPRPVSSTGQALHGGDRRGAGVTTNLLRLER